MFTNDYISYIMNKLRPQTKNVEKAINLCLKDPPKCF